jgi:hypothetical protein
MNPFEGYTIHGDRAEYRPTGEMTLFRAVQLVTAAIVRTRENGIRNLLINVSHLTGFDSPDVVTRYHFVQEWANAAAGAVRIVFVARPELIDPRKFGVTVAANSGLETEVFVTEAEALQWMERKMKP